MKLHLDSSNYIETNEPIDISISLVDGEKNLRAWYVDPPQMKPVMENGFVGSVALGGSVNFRSIFFNPHGHGTHTECLGHITPEIYSINQSLKTYFFKAQLVTVTPIETAINGELDAIIHRQLLKEGEWDGTIDALLIRTIPNSSSKTHNDYSATNPPYLSLDCIALLNDRGIKHLLIDLPSVDRENDGGALAFHHQFWGVPDNLNFERTITELIYVPDSVEDGTYLLELQTAPFENDASPSRPILYQIKKG
jgi:kynurenine formamidase